jgi:inner membrane protein
MSDVGQSIGRVIKSPAFKFFLICTLILMLLVPLLIVQGLVGERAGRAEEVGAEVARTWGSQQQLFGPFVVVPYTVRLETKEGDKRVEQTQERRAVFLPEALTIDGKSVSKVLHRSIFDVNVYTATLSLDGRFLALDMAEVEPNAVSVRWRDAILVLGLSDVSGLKEAATLKLNGQETVPFAPSLGLPTTNVSGIHVKLAQATSLFPSAEAPLPAFSFHVDLVYSGSSMLSFAPAARDTRVALASDWPHPSFSGAFLPAERTVTEQGFTASWRVPHLARSVPNAWSLADAPIDRFAPYQFGVTFYQPVEFYDLVSRAVKYGALFLALGFMGVFVIELLSRKRVHPVQYLFVGLAMVFFYVLLLSLAEHTGFAAAYLAASGATGGMLSLYVGKALDSRESGLAMLALFLAVYGFLYLILTLEDYALLAGALFGFAALTGVMFATLKVDWSAGGAEAPASAAPEE